jgi:PKD repeat protein
MVVLINNIDPNDTTSGPPGCLQLDNIRLAGCNPIDTSPASQNVNEGEAVALRVSTSRADSADVLTFQWKKDGADIAGANDSVFTLASVKTADAGVYTVAVTVSSSNLSFTSQSATLTVDTKEEGCGCGAGTGAAIIPPLFFKAMAHRKRKKKNQRI